MTNEEKLAFILETLRTVLRKNIDRISPEMSLVTDLGLDSLDTVELYIHYEEVHGPISEDANPKTVKELMDLMV